MPSFYCGSSWTLNGRESTSLCILEWPTAHLTEATRRSPWKAQAYCGSLLSKPRRILSWHRAASLPCPPAKAGRRNGAAASPELSQESTGALNRELAARTLRCRTFFLDRIARSGVR